MAVVPPAGRPTADLVLLMVTGVLAGAILLSGAGLFVLALLNPGRDLAALFGAFGQVIALLAGSVLGYLAGKGRSPYSRET